MFDATAFVPLKKGCSRRVCVRVSMSGTVCVYAYSREQNAVHTKRTQHNADAANIMRVEARQDDTYAHVQNSANKNPNQTR